MADWNQELGPWAPVWFDEQPIGAVDPIGMFAPPSAAPVEPEPVAPVVPGLGIPETVFQPVAEQALVPAPMDPYAAEPAPSMFGDLQRVEDEGGFVAPPIEEGPVIAPDYVPGIADGEAPITATSMLPDERAPANPYVWNGHPLDDPYLTQDELNQRAIETSVNDPMGFAKWQAVKQHEAQTAALEEQLKLSQENQSRIQRNFDDRQAAVQETQRKMAMLDQQAAEIANRKIDPDRYMNSRSEGQKFAQMIAVIAGGVMAGSSGNGSGRNPFLEDIDRSIDRDIDAQKADIANAQHGVATRRGLLAEAYQMTGDMFVAQEAVRQAAYTSAIGDLQTKLQLRDPRGTQAQMIAGSVNELIAKRAASRAAAEKTAWDREMQLREQLRKEADTAADIAKKQAEAAKMLAKKGGGGSTKPRPVTPEYGAWLNKNKTVDGPGARASFGEELANVQRAQAAWDAANKGGGARIAPSARTSSAPAGSAPGMAPTTQAAPAQGVGAPVSQPETRQEYKTKSDWFSVNRPGLPDTEKKQFWFVDGKNGSEVPPVELEAGVDPEKFVKGQRIRREMAVKADQLRLMTEKLQQRGFWDKAVASKISWKNDADLSQARALSEDFVGLVIQAKEMGVPSGNDVERVRTMVGGDPGGWKDPLPALQRARESIQLEQDADWGTASPSTFNDPTYNRYRVLPAASPEWVEKYTRRGEIKTIRPEQGNADPKQLEKVRIDVAGDAPNVAEARAQEARSRNTDEANRYLEASGEIAGPENELAAAGLGLGSSSKAIRLPQLEDFRYRGKPAGADAYEQLRKQYVINVRSLDRYLSGGKESDWSEFKKAEKLSKKWLTELINSDVDLSNRYLPQGSRLRSTWTSDPEAIARITGEILRSGGK